MPDLTIPTGYVTQFTQNLRHRPQQKGSRFRPHMTEGRFTGEDAQTTMDLEMVEARETTERYGDTPIMGHDLNATWIFPRMFEWGTLLDKQDKIRSLIDPQGPLVEAARMAMGRTIDKVAIPALFADVMRGENDNRVVTAFPAEQKLAADIGGTGDQGMNAEKIRAGLEIFHANDVDMDMADICLAFGPKQNRELMAEAEILGTEYRHNVVIKHGQIVEYDGIPCILSNKLEKASANRRCALFAKQGLSLGVWDEIAVNVAPNPQKKFRPHLFLEQAVGAARNEDKLVVEIPCKEA